MGPSRVVRASIVVLCLGLAAPSAISAHDIPSRVAVLAFVKPEGRTLRLVARVPLEAMRDMDIPLRGTDYLDVAAVRPQLHDAAQLWLAEYIELFEGDTKLASPRIVATQISLPSDRSFETYTSAVAHVLSPGLSAETELPWRQAMLDVVMEYSIDSDRSRFSIRPQLAHLGVRTTTVLRFLAPNGSERDFEYVGNPGLVRLDPRWHQAALRFVALGFQHIMGGIDHLLFVFCLVIPFRKPRPLIAIVTSFTVAHSMTLIASAMGLAPKGLWFPPLIEVLIALSILYMAFENIVGPKLQRRWLIAFAFGLVHGFGFSFALRESMQFAGGHLLASLVSFNIGVEIGQLAVLTVAIPALTALFRWVVRERVGTIILSALVAHTAWHWMVDRVSVLRQYPFAVPALSTALLVSVVRALMVLLVLAGVIWLLYGTVGRLIRAPEGDTAARAER